MTNKKTDINMIDVKTDKDLTADNIDEYNGYNIRIKKLNGYIYRGDYHKNIVLPVIPRFYGTEESAAKYMHNNEYLKKYSTSRELILINLTNDSTENNKTTIAFFRQLLKEFPKDELRIKMTIIMLQLFFGIMYEAFDDCGLSESIIKHYLKQRHVELGNISVFFVIVKLLKQQKIIPSRCSIKIFDEILMNNLKQILSRINIDGVFFVAIPHTTKEVRSCLLANFYFRRETCVPTEIIIFEPIKNFNKVEIWKWTKKGFVFINKKINKYNNTNIIKSNNF